MRTTHLLPVIAAGVLLLAAPGISSAQIPAPPASKLSAQSEADLKALNQLIADIQVQQQALAANQALIDQKLATLNETIRVARIFTKRGGGGSK